jgi:hypothetical protein
LSLVQVSEVSHSPAEMPEIMRLGMSRWWRRRPALEAVRSITLSATGDIMMSDAPSRMPPADGDGFFGAVRDDLSSDLVMGNLEQPLTGETGAPNADRRRRPTASPSGRRCLMRDI